MLVFDTSAFINGWRDHYAPNVFPSVWDLIGQALGNEMVISPREVYRELTKKDDEVAAWAKVREASFVDPGPAVQAEAGQISALLPNPGIRNGADPFVLAEAKIRQMTVVTYEGRNFSGPTKNWAKRMPGVCQVLKIPCCTLPEALGRLGGRF
jgi:hypothetical protein